MWLFERSTLIHGWHLQDLTVPDCNVSSSNLLHLQFKNDEVN